MSTLIENKVGALIVQNNVGDLLGIITKRDLMREVHKEADLKSPIVQDVMNRQIIAGNHDHDIEYVMAEMTQGRFRHMPVVDVSGLVGIISIGDIVKAKLQYAQEEVTQYKDFVTLGWRSS